MLSGADTEGVLGVGAAGESGEGRILLHKQKSAVLAEQQHWTQLLMCLRWHHTLICGMHLYSSDVTVIK